MFGAREPAKPNLITFGNETFDKFLGGGLLNSSLNLFERQGPSGRLLEPVLENSLVASTLVSGNNLIYVNFNTSSEIDRERHHASLPMPRKVKSEMMYKDVRGKSAAAKIKIAWRYSNRDSSPSDGLLQMNQVDFGLSLSKETEKNNLGILKVINLVTGSTLNSIFCALEDAVSELKGPNKTVNIIIHDLLHPFSVMIDNPNLLCNFMYILRCFARTVGKGVILVDYDTDMCKRHSQIKHYLYNLADSVVSFHSYETGENILTGYKSIDGTLDYVKVPKINSFGPHFQRELSDWGYRFTKNHRFLVVDELSLPPCDDAEDDDKTKKQKASAITRIEQRPLEQVGPLEDFREIAGDVLAKKL